MKNMKSLIFVMFVLFYTNSQAQTDVTKTLRLNDSLPEVIYQNENNVLVSLKKDYAGQKLVLLFYRANWCPYCNAHLSEMQEIEKDLIRKGYKIIAVSAEKPADLKVTREKNETKYIMLSDFSKKALDVFGINNGAGHFVPTCIITDKNHVIRYIYSNADYKQRVSADEVLGVITQIQ